MGRVYNLGEGMNIGLSEDVVPLNSVFYHHVFNLSIYFFFGGILHVPFQRHPTTPSTIPSSKLTLIYGK